MLQTKCLLDCLSGGWATFDNCCNFPPTSQWLCQVCGGVKIGWVWTSLSLNVSTWVQNNGCFSLSENVHNHSHWCNSSCTVPLYDGRAQGYSEHYLYTWMTQHTTRFVWSILRPLVCFVVCPCLTLWQGDRPDADSGQSVGSGEGDQTTGVHM